MLSYILEVSICWSAFYLLYWLLLSRDTFFHFNRWYLVSTLLASLVIPAVEWELPVAESEIATVYFQPITVGVETFEVTVTATPITSGVELLDVLTWMYWAGMAFFMLRFLIGMRQIYRLYRRSEKRYRNGYQIILSEKVHPPFSFFNSLFLSKSVELDAEDRDAILRHELAHIRGGHSYDILILEILNAIFWCSPFIYLYRRSLRNVHEYIADAAVLRTTKKKQYGHLLIRQSQSGPAIAIANHFHSQLKKRILMMMRNPSKRRAMLKYLLVIPLTLLVLLVFSNAEAQESLQQQAEEVQQFVGEKLYSNTPTNSNVGQNVVTKVWGENFTKLEIVDGDIRFEAKDGVTIKMDTIPISLNSKSADDRVINFEIYYANGEVEKLTKIVNENEILKKINPSDIEAIDVYRDNGENLIKIWMKGARMSKPLEVTELDETPRLLGCEHIADKEARDRCAQSKMLEFVYTNIKYPAEARLKGVQGNVIVAFTIDENGNVKDPKIMRGIGGGCDEEVIRIVKQMPRWEPGKKAGKKVSSVIALPVKYILEEKDSKEIIVPREKSSNQDTIVTFDPVTYKETVKIVDYNKNGIFVVGYGEAKQAPSLLPDPVLDKIYKQDNPPTSLFAADVLQILDGQILSKSELQELDKKFKQAGGRMSTEMLTTLTPEVATKRYGEKGKNGAIIYQGLKFGESKENNSEIFKIVEEMPRFPGCEDSPGDEKVKKDCADRLMLEFIYKNIKYPQEARNKGIEGICVVSFIVGKDGVIREPKAVRSIGAGCDEEVIRLVNLMPKWIPGKQRGRVVDVQFMLPIRFKLSEEDKQQATAPANVKLPENTLQLQNFKASPNPTNGILNLSFRGERKPTLVKVFDLQGKELQSFNIQNFDGTFNEQLDLSNIPKGTLIINVLQGEKTYSEKVILQ